MLFLRSREGVRYLLTDKVCEGQGWSRYQFAFVEFEALAWLFREPEEFFDVILVVGFMSVLCHFGHCRLPCSHIMILMRRIGDDPD